jgi:hypothetical protein
VAQAGSLVRVGTVYGLIGFDAQAWRREVAPLVLETVCAGYERPRVVAPVRDDPRWVNRYVTLREPPRQVLHTHFADLALSVFGNCEAIGPDLGLRDPAVMIGTYVGPCRVLQCPDQSDCPLHHLGRSGKDHGMGYELFTDAVRELIKQHCLYGEATWVGRYATWLSLREWYLEELGLDVYHDHQDDMIRPYLGTDPLAGLLLRLTRRGALIGPDGDGGLQGWLDHDETTALAAALEPYDLRPDVPMPTTDSDVYSVQMNRETMAHLRAAATDLAGRGLGIALWGNP